MRRREFITLLDGAAVAWPVVAGVQKRSAPRRLGVLMGYVANDPEGATDAAAFLQGLGALSWKEGSNLRIDWRWGGSDPALFERYAAEPVTRIKLAASHNLISGLPLGRRTPSHLRNSAAEPD